MDRGKGEKKRYKKEEVYTISFAHLSHDIFSSILAPILPLLIERLGISLSMASFLDIARKIPSLFNPFLGLMAERRDVKYFVILTPAITAISMCLLGVTSSYIVALLLLFIAGISATLFHIPSPTMIKIASGEQTGKGMSWFMVGGESARTIGPLLVTGAISLWGFEGIYRLMPIGILSSLFLYYKLKNFQVKDFSTKKIESGETKKLLKQLSSFFIILGSYLLFNAGTKSAITLYLPVYLTKHNFSIYEAGISLSVLQFFGILGTFFSGRFSDKIGRKNMLFISAIGTTFAMLLFIYFNKTALFPILAILGFFLFTTGPVMLATVQDTNTSKPTFVNSLYMGINFGISSLVVFLVGYLADIYGLDRVYLGCTLFTFLSLFVIIFLPTNKKVQNG